MTSLYGSKAQPRKIFGEGELLFKFYETMQKETPGIWALNQALLSLWQPDALMHEWVLPDNFHVKIKVMDDHYETVQFMNRPYQIHTKVNKPTPEGLSISANMVHSIDGMMVREMVRRCTYDEQKILSVMSLIRGATARKNTGTKDDRMVMTLWDRFEKTGFLSARILDHLNVSNFGHVNSADILDLIKSMPEKPFPVLTVHDCFRVHPNYANDLRRQYNQLLSSIAGSSILQDIAGQVVGYPLTVSKMGNLSQEALIANYALS